MYCVTLLIKEKSLRGKSKEKGEITKILDLFWKVRITICYRDIKCNSLHIHLVNDKHEGFVPVGIQVATLHAGLLLLSNPLLLNINHFHFRPMWSGTNPQVLLYPVGRYITGYSHNGEKEFYQRESEIWNSKKTKIFHWFVINSIFYINSNFLS